MVREYPSLGSFSFFFDNLKSNDASIGVSDMAITVENAEDEK